MKSRRYFLKQGTLATAAMLVGKPFMSFRETGSFLFSERGLGGNVMLLHTNDLHNHLAPLNHDVYSGLGGFETTARVISSIKQEHKNVLLLDAGDIFCGNSRHQTEQETTLQMMKSAGYDAVLLGNRDYEAGIDYLQEKWAKHNIPLVASNYSYKAGWLKNSQQPYKIVRKGTIKIGIVGAGIDMKGLAPVSGSVQYNDPLKEVTTIATMLKQEEKCQLVVCLSHLGYKNKNAIDDITLAAQSKNIDIIIGGHSHTFMQAPQIVLNKHQQEVIINHAAYGGTVLGTMTISFDEHGIKSKVSFNNLMVGTENNKWIQKNPLPS